MPRISSEKSNGPEAGDSSDPLFADHHALLVGISKYEAQERIDWTLKKIPCASCDARLLRKILKSVGYPRLQLHYLCNKKATLNNIQQKLDELCSMWRVRLLLLFWAGHGVFSGTHQKNFLLPYEANVDDLSHTAFSVDEIIKQIKGAKASSRAIFLDTCHSAPRSDRLLLPEWNKLDHFSADPALTFVGASTHLALEKAGHGGILTACLGDAFGAYDDTLCDKEGTVELDDVMIYLQRNLRRRVRAAWEESGRSGEAPQHPYIVRQLGASIPVGRNVSAHVRCCVDRSKLPGPVRRLASMLISEHLFGVPRR